MKKVRSLSAIIAVALALSAAGCSDTAQSTVKETSEETTTTTASEEPSEAVSADSGESDEADEAGESSASASETSASEHDFDTEYFRSVEEGLETDFDDADIAELAKEYEDDGYQVDSMSSLAEWLSYDFPLYEGEPDIDNIYAYLYRGFCAYKVEDGTQYAYECVKATEDILENDLGFTKKSEEGDLITYSTPDTSPYRVYSYDSYVFDRSTGILKASQEMYIGEGVG